MSFDLEKDWITKAGLRAVAICINDMGHRCGYVGVPKDHPLYGVSYHEPCAALAGVVNDETPIGKRGVVALLCASADSSGNRFTTPELAFDVHGGITFSGGGDYPVPSDLYWFGFDCAHAGDGSAYSNGPVRSLEYVIDECESLAQQIANVHQREAA